MTEPTAHMSSASCEAQRRRDQLKTPASGILNKWRTIASILMSYAFAISRLERTRGAGAWEMVEELEVAARAGFIQITAEISDAYAQNSPHTEDEARTKEHLHAIACCLFVLTFLAREARLRLAGQSASGFQFANAIAQCPVHATAMTYPAAIYDIPILDPG